MGNLVGKHFEKYLQHQLVLDHQLLGPGETQTVQYFGTNPDDDEVSLRGDDWKKIICE